MEIGFWIPPVSGIPYSLSSIPDSKAQDSCISQAKYSPSPVSTSSGIRIPLHGGHSRYAAALLCQGMVFRVSSLKLSEHVNYI